jgi:hypothetical protein
MQGLACKASLLPRSTKTSALRLGKGSTMLRGVSLQVDYKLLTILQMNKLNQRILDTSTYKRITKYLFTYEISTKYLMQDLQIKNI